MTGLNFKRMYLTLALTIGVSSCSITKNMVFVNGPKDLEYKVNAGTVNQEAINNMQKGLYAFKDFDNKCIPYQSLIRNNKQYEFGHPYSIMLK